MPAGERASSASTARLVHQHAAGAQDQRLDDQRREVVAVAVEQGGEGVQRRLLAAGSGERQEIDLEQHRLVGRGEDAARADRHRAEGVAVIAVREGDDAVPWPADVVPVAHRHLQSDLHRGRTGVGEENELQRFTVPQTAVPAPAACAPAARRAGG